MGVEPFFRDAPFMDVRARAICRITKAEESGCGTSAELANAIVRDVLAIDRVGSLAHCDSRAICHGKNGMCRDLRPMQELELLQA
jgi:hypothetical protein